MQRLTLGLIKLSKSESPKPEADLISSLLLVVVVVVVLPQGSILHSTVNG